MSTKRKKNRPRHETLGDVLKRILDETVSVKINGKPTRLTQYDLVLERLREEALKGDRQAIKLLLDFAKRDVNTVPPENLYHIGKPPNAL
jgi:hypothetical protein